MLVDAGVSARHEMRPFRSESGQTSSTATWHMVMRELASHRIIAANFIQVLTTVGLAIVL